MARIDLIRDAERPKMNARALFQGPQGSGKTWTMLSVARSLTKGTAGRILGIDTERESMLTYADVFTFKHLPWRPPYAPDELTQVLDQLGGSWVETPDDVIIIDSFSHYWQGSGGILDIASGRVQGGWDKARPMQNALVEQLLAMPCHILLGARMKNTVLVSDGGKTIENVGLTITQDDSLGYELNIVVQMDMNHSIAVMKSRTPAVPVGRLYPGGSESKLAADYAEWLAGGVPPANREDVEAIVGVFGGIADRARRKVLKDAFVEAFGMPHSLTAEQVPDARAWLAEQGAPVGEGPAADEQGDPAGDDPQDGPDAPGAPDTPDEGPEAPDGDQGPASDDDGDQAPAPDDDAGDGPDRDPDLRDPDEEPLPLDDADDPAPDDTPALDAAAIVAQVQALVPAAIKSRLQERHLKVTGNAQTLASRLAGALMVEAGIADPSVVAMVTAARTASHPDRVAADEPDQG